MNKATMAGLLSASSLLTMAPLPATAMQMHPWCAPIHEQDPMTAEEIKKCFRHAILMIAQGKAGNGQVYVPSRTEGGIVGTAGPDGETGDVGAAGPIGAVGPAGSAGAPGSPGAAGPAGADGGVGATGPTGPQGQAGNPGETGAVGPTGPAGSSIPPA